mmetsp:Transcript_129668/g.314956  ORF Transcript_129668/g.314956 Transcript_129668/m.314956 type:complete len:211 (-) Transcript_129668:114-746(-)
MTCPRTSTPSWALMPRHSARRRTRKRAQANLRWQRMVRPSAMPATWISSHRWPCSTSATRSAWAWEASSTARSCATPTAASSLSSAPRQRPMARCGSGSSPRTSAALERAPSLRQQPRSSGRGSRWSRPRGPGPPPAGSCARSPLRTSRSWRTRTESRCASAGTAACLSAISSASATTRAQRVCTASATRSWRSAACGRRPRPARGRRPP